jgi:hypothetical protein
MDSIQNWRDADGDNTYALDWSIDSQALVWEIGGYEGRWAAQMVEKFDPWMRIFEPQDWAFRKLHERFKENNKILLYPFGLWIETAFLPLFHFETDGASLLNEGGRDKLCDFREIGQILRDEIRDIDVCLMNIEGAEFVLLPYLFRLDLMKRFRFFWCQFHTFADPGGKAAYWIYHEMNKTHNLIWDFYPTAVAWERR